MSDLVSFEILNPISDKNKPYFDNKNNIFVIPLKIGYTYYVETKLIEENGITNYYLLLGFTKFNNNARRCNVDNYGRCKIRIGGEFKDFVINECKERGNINVTYIESKEDYDIYLVE